MKRILLFMFLASIANAGVVRVVTFPVRHPVRAVRRATKTVLFPVVHPVKTAKGLWWFVW